MLGGGPVDKGPVDLGLQQVVDPDRTTGKGEVVELLFDRFCQVKFLAVETRIQLARAPFLLEAPRNESMSPSGDVAGRVVGLTLHGAPASGGDDLGHDVDAVVVGLTGGAAAGPVLPELDLLEAVGEIGQGLGSDHQMAARVLVANDAGRAHEVS